MKRALSLLCAIVMTVSMLAGIVLPAMAETADSPSAQSTERPVSYAESLVNYFDLSKAVNRVFTNAIDKTPDLNTSKYHYQFSTSELIPVTEGDVIMFGPCRTTQGYQLVVQDADNINKHSVISSNIADYTAFTLEDDINDDMVFCKFTVPEGMKTVRVTAENIVAQEYLLTINQEYTLQNWKDWVAAQNPADTLVNLFAENTPLGRWDASSTTALSSSSFYAPARIDVAVNDVVYFGPCNIDAQDYQLVYFNAEETGASVKNNTNSTANAGENANNGTLKVVDTFDNGQVIYAYRAKAAGKIGIAVPAAYGSFALITKNQPLTTQNYYNYWDSKADANLYNITLDLNAGHYNANGTWSEQGNHRSSHSIAVQPGEVIEMGPCYNKTTSYLVVAMDINRQNGYTISQTSASFEQLATTTGDDTMDDGGNAGLLMRFTVPDGIYYIHLILRKGQYDAYTARKVTPLTDSDNLYDSATAPYGRWTAAETAAVASWEYHAPPKIQVKAGDVIYFGPAKYSQGYQVAFNSTDGTVAVDVANATAGQYTNAAGSLNVYDYFGNTANVIYAYRATQDGTVALPVRTEFGDQFMVTKNKPFSAGQFHTYWDSKEGTNLYAELLDYATVMNSDGSLGTTVNHCTTHDIAVAPGQTVSFGPVQISQGYDLVIKDALGRALGTANGTQGEIISKTDLTYITDTSSEYAIFSYTAPADGSVRYINVVNRTWVKQFFATVYGTMTAAEYYDYIGIVPAGESVIDGKKALFVGDSISAAANDSSYMKGLGRGAWAGRVAWSYQLTSTNNSVSGSTLAINTGRTYINDQLTKSKNSDFDYVVIQGGVNDANVGVREGEISESFDPGTFDLTTYAGALEYNIYTAIDLYGDTAAIGYIINYPVLHRPNQQYARFGDFVDTAMAICEKWGIRYLDLYNNEELAEKIDLSTSASPYMQDNLHITARGYDEVYPYVGDWMNTLTPYSTGESTADVWNELADSMITQAGRLDSKYFTAESVKAFQDAANAQTSKGFERYNETVALVDTLKQADEPIPFSLNGTSLLYNEIFKQAYTFSVSTPAEMKLLAAQVNAGNLNSGAVIRQTAHIDLSDNANLMLGTTASTPFNATYDGQDHQIVGLSLKNDVGYMGLFPYLNGTVKNLIINQATADTKGWVGLLAFRALGNTVVENVHVIDSSVTVTAGNSVSTMIGEYNDSGSLTLRNCTVSGSTLKSTSTARQGNASFILGSTKGKPCTVENTHAFGNTLTYNGMLANGGGLIGEMWNANTATVKNSSAFHNTFSYPSKEGDSVGGMAGLCEQINTFENCYTDAASATELTKGAQVLTAASAITENLYTGAAVEVKAGETVFLGPVDIDEATYGSFTAAEGTVELTLANVIPVDSFDCHQAILAYRAAADGTLAANVNKAYEDLFVIAKGGENEAISCQTYYNYVDNLPGANLYISQLDSDPGFFQGIGSANGAVRPHRDTHTFAVKEGDVVTFGPSNTNQGYHAKTFDADMGFIENIKAQLVASEGTVTSGLVFYTYTVPAGVSYMTVINYSPVQSRFVVLKNAGSLTPATYYDYLGTNTADNPLYGKSALYVGDSICYATRDNIQNGIRLSWGGRIALANNMTYVNAGVSGASLSSTRDSGAGRITTQLQSQAENDFDYVVIQGGVNDAWDNAPIGTMSDSFDPATFNEDTYAGGLELAFYTALKSFGDQATVIYLINYETPLHSLTNDSGAYFEVGRRICEKWGIPYIDLYTDEVAEALMYTTKLNANTFVSSPGTDYVHVSNLGYDIITPYIEEGMKLASAGDIAWDALLASYTAAADALSSDHFTADSISALKAALAAVSGTNEEKLAACEAAASTLVPIAESAVALGDIDSNYYYDYHRAAFKNYTVSTGADMVVLADMVNGKEIVAGDMVTQLAGIDMKDYPNTIIGATNDTAFAGTYDGQGHTVSNVTFSGSRIGFFSRLTGTVKNVTFDQAEATTNGWSGIVVGHTVGTTAVLDNVHLTNSTMKQEGNNNGIGLLIGMPTDTTSDDINQSFTVRNCTVVGCTVTSNSTVSRVNVGFIASRTLGVQSVIENTYVYGNTFRCLNAYGSVGGMVGESQNLLIKNSGAFNNTFVSTNGEVTALGGLVGQGKIGTVNVTDSYTDLDRIVGSATYSEGNATVVETNCYASVTDLTSGELAYKLKNGTETNWIQTATHPVVGEGKAVVKVAYVVDEATVATTYTNAAGELIAPYTETPAKDKHLFSAWSDTTAENGDITKTAVFYHEWDLNNNGGDPGVDDVIILLRKLVGYDEDIDTARADINDDSKLSIYDAVLLLRFVSAV